MHRIVEVTRDNEIIQYTTKGDNNNVADSESVKVSQIKGVYVCTIKYLGFPSIWLHDYFLERGAWLEYEKAQKEIIPKL